MGWKCPDESCGFDRNFANKSECFKCQTAKGDAKLFEIPERGPKKNMGWKCASCNFERNFSSKTECFKC